MSRYMCNVCESSFDPKEFSPSKPQVAKLLIGELVAGDNICKSILLSCVQECTVPCPNGCSGKIAIKVMVVADCEIYDHVIVNAQLHEWTIQAANAQLQEPAIYYWMQQ